MWADDEDARLSELVKQGLSLSEMVEQMGFGTRGTLRARAVLLGYIVRKPGCRSDHQAWDEERLNKLRVLAETGQSIAACARSMNVAPGTLSDAARRHDVEFVHRRRHRLHRIADAAEKRLCPRPELHPFAPGNLVARLMGDPPPGRTPWAQP